MKNLILNQRWWVLLGVIYILASFLRLWNLETNPAGFFRDEADKGFTTLLLLETGYDQSGDYLPLFVKSLNVTTSALYQYVNIPFVSIFGMNEWTVRLPAALAGSVSVLAVFGLASLFWGNQYGLWAALFLALSPWSLLMSRWANQSIFLTLWIPLGVLCFMLWCRSQKPMLSACGAAFCFLLAFYTYAPARLVVPVFVLGLLILLVTNLIYEKKLVIQQCLALSLFLSLMILGSLPMAYHVLAEQAESTARLSAITIFDGQSFMGIIAEFTRNYFLHFSPDFLFISGDENIRHNTAVFGQVHWYLLPLIIIGVVQCLRKRRLEDLLLLWWLIIFPIAAACTRESIPHALRSMFAIPIFQLMAVRGIVALLETSEYWSKFLSPQLTRSIKMIWMASLVLLPAIHLYDLYFRYPIYSAPWWQYGYKESVEWWVDNRQQADHTIVSGIAEYPEIFFLFYGDLDLEQWLKDKQIDGVTFVQRGQPAELLLSEFEGQLLLLVRPDEMSYSRAQKVIRLPDGTPVWKWVSWGASRSD